VEKLMTDDWVSKLTRSMYGRDFVSMWRIGQIVVLKRLLVDKYF
jgi:hypothetical protein